MALNFKIKTIVVICLIFLGGIGFTKAQIYNGDEFKTGADQPELYLKLLKDKNVAVVTNQTGIVTKKTYVNVPRNNGTGGAKGIEIDKKSIVDFLVENKIKVKTIFAPEHGFRGDADAGEKVKNGIDIKTGIPTVSLYGANKKPKPEQLKGIDVIVFDIQDVGVRFYTYISTLAYIMEAAAQNDIEVIVLDRPNPHDGYTDGPILKKKWESFVGMHEVPVVYGLTIAEYGKMINGQKWLAKGLQAKYTVIPMQNYHKKKRYGVSDKPSPNLPNDLAINLYPSLCFFEGTQVSVGRGTPLPFQIYGSPWTKNLPYQFTPMPSFGAKDPFLNGQICYGENLSGRKPDLRKLDISWLLKAYSNYKNPQQNFFLTNLFFDKLAGSDEFRNQIIAKKSEKEIRSSWEKDLRDYEVIRKKYVIYKD